MTRLVTADARKVSGLDFFDAVTGSSPEQREERRRFVRESCIRAIRNGDTYGFPPLLVEECREIMAVQEAVERDLRFTMELQRKDEAA